MSELCRPLGPRDSLSRDHLLHVADAGGSLGVKIAVGALVGLLLALAVNLGEEPSQPVERLALPAAAAPPAIEFDR